MTDVMINLRRSPRKLLERDGHPGPGPGSLALVMARAGVGKTAFLVDIGMDALLAGQKVLHIALDSSVEKVRTWYDDILMEMLRSEKKLDHWAPIQLDVERRRHVHAYVGHSFTSQRLGEAIALLKDVMEFEPQVILLDGMEAIDAKAVAGVKELAAQAGAELWMTCRISRDAASGEHLPPPANEIDSLVDLAFRLDPHDSKIRLHVLKDRDERLDKDLHVLLDPQTLLLTVGLGG
jgi:hypothetical protein